MQRVDTPKMTYKCILISQRGPALCGPAKTAERLTYEYLRERIIHGLLPSGAAIRQQDVATQIGVSRIPVRDAIRHLAAEGLVTIESNRRVVVTSMTTVDVGEIFQIRAVLEGLAARAAAPKITPSALDRLSTLAGQLDRSSSNVDEWNRFHQEFHDVICQQAGMRRLYQDIVRLRSAVEPYLRLIISTYGFAAKSGRNHRPVLSALRKRNAAAAESAMRELILRSLDQLSNVAKTKQGKSNMRAASVPAVERRRS